jgi:tetracycline 7-halogenase / FADH2 O2-dependent halogenase
MSLEPVERIDADVAIVGSGFAGSLTALALLRRGRSVVLIERGRHPRFAIGESSTPLANLLLEELSDRYDLPRIRAFSKWGSWQRTRPDVACGLKRGFTFFFHRPGEAFADSVDHRRQLLVAASPHDEIADTHWYRPQFDHALALEAQAEGAAYLDMTRLERIRHEGECTILEGAREGRSVRITARFVIDASGPRGFLHGALGLGEALHRWLPGTQGLYTHFEGVERWDQLTPSPEQPPYPVDDAALHHVLPGGWIWMLRFNNGVTSAGAALTDPLAASLVAAEGAPAWHRLLATLPSVADQFRSARAVLPFVHTPRVAFRSRRVSGPAWALLPSAAGVIDPLLSTGFPLTLRAGDSQGTGRDRMPRRRPVRDHDRRSAVQAAQPALLRSRQLQRDRTAARPSRSGARVSALRASDVRPSVDGVCVACRGRSPGFRTACPDRAHRPRH